MEFSFGWFISQVVSSPILLVTVLLTLGVVFVNGWTDAPNAIATCVATRAMSAKAAVLMSAVFNLLGTFVMTLVNTTVAMTIKNMVNFDGNTGDATVALCAALFAIIIWAVAAWYFGILQKFVPKAPTIFQNCLFEQAPHCGALWLERGL